MSLFIVLPCIASQEIEPQLYQWCQETRDILEQPYDALINLGGECQVAYQMRLHGIRSESLPFDWIITPFESLVKIVQERFENFLKKENLVFIENEKEKYVFDTYYGIRFLHDFKLQPDFIKDYDRIQQTYARRIERFLELLQKSKHALFIRKTITKEQAITLRSLLQSITPDNTFIILAADQNPHTQQPWNLDQIKNFYLETPVPASWKGDAQSWENAFAGVGLQLNPEAAP